MRDGINLAKLGIPSVALVTEEFWAQGNFVAESLGMPGAPRVQLPHPVAGTGAENMTAVADCVAQEILAALEARSD